MSSYSELSTFLMSTSKAAKSIIFTAQASDNHNAIKLRNVLKWLKSGHEVRVRINGKQDRMKGMEAVYKELEKEVSSGSRILQKVIKPDSIRFTLMPTSEASNFKIEDATRAAMNEEELISDISPEKDIFSDDFEKELAKSIREERTKNKRR